MELDKLLDSTLSPSESYDIGELFNKQDDVVFSEDYQLKIEIDTVLSQLSILGKAEKQLVRFKGLDLESLTESEVELEELALSSVLGTSLTAGMSKDGLLTKIRKTASSLLDKFFKFVSRIFKRLFGIESKQDKKAKQQVKKIEVIEDAKRKDLSLAEVLKIETQVASVKRVIPEYTDMQLAFVSTAGMLSPDAVFDFMTERLGIINRLEDELLDLRNLDVNDDKVIRFLMMPKSIRENMIIRENATFAGVVTTYTISPVAHSMRPLMFTLDLGKRSFSSGPDFKTSSKFKAEQAKLAGMYPRYSELSKRLLGQTTDISDNIIEAMKKGVDKRLENVDAKAEIDRVTATIKVCVDLYVALKKYLSDCHSAVLTLGDQILQAHVAENSGKASYV